MNKPWYKIIDFYRLTGIALIWIASWLFMIPWKTDITSPVFDNIWGSLFAIFGATVDKTVETQQTPDLACGIIAFCLIVILQLRGILSITTITLKDGIKTGKNKPLIITLDLVSIIVHTLFFTMLIKIFLFPDKGMTSIQNRLQQNITLTIFAAVCIAGMIFGATSIAKLFVMAFTVIAVFNNVKFVSDVLGLWGFLAILLAVSGFYLEFCVNGFNRRNIEIDLALLTGRYDKIEFKGKSHD